jgi:hypothetical protein
LLFPAHQIHRAIPTIAAPKYAFIRQKHAVDPKKHDLARKKHDLRTTDLLLCAATCRMSTPFTRKRTNIIKAGATVEEEGQKYHIYLLTVWYELPDEGGPHWRYRLSDPQSGLDRGFVTPQALPFVLQQLHAHGAAGAARNDLP